MEYLFYISVLVAITVGIVCSLNITLGYANLPLLGHFAFPLAGAYAMGLATTHFALPPAIGVLAAAVAGAALGLVFVLPAMGLNSESTALGTVAIALLFQAVLNNWIGVTGGPFGIAGISEILPLAGIGPFFATAFVALLYAAGSFSLQIMVRNSQFGRLLIVSGESERLLPYLGRSPVAVRASVVMLSGAWAAVGGAIYAALVGYVSPTSYVFNDSILFVVMLLLGGRATMAGPIVGTAIVMLAVEVLRFLNLPAEVAAQTRAILLGAILIGTIAVRPHGIFGRRSAR